MNFEIFYHSTNIASGSPKAMHTSKNLVFFFLFFFAIEYIVVYLSINVFSP